MIDIKQTQDLIKQILTRLGHKYASDEAVELVLGTFIYESRFKYWTQLKGGPAKGFAQIEYDTCLDNIENYLKFRPELIDRFVWATGIPKRYYLKPSKRDWEYFLMTNFAAQVCHARIKYWRAPAKLPQTSKQMSEYYKKYYNSVLGKGDAEEYVEIVYKYL
tara:strand:- start:60 stop:545 length:486 start_codon:yes stop_codon:yes gene_type:complete